MTSMAEDHTQTPNTIREADKQGTRAPAQCVRAPTNTDHDSILPTYRAGGQPAPAITRGNIDGTIRLTITHDSMQAHHETRRKPTNSPTGMPLTHADQPIQHYPHEAITVSQHMPGHERQENQPPKDIDTDMDGKRMLRNIDRLSKHMPGKQHTPATPDPSINHINPPF